jgi:predicted Fe-S protein YdhL (DUF1289 family)
MLLHSTCELLTSSSDLVSKPYVCAHCGKGFAKCDVCTGCLPTTQVACSWVFANSFQRFQVLLLAQERLENVLRERWSQCLRPVACISDAQHMANRLLGCDGSFKFGRREFS